MNNPRSLMMRVTACLDASRVLLEKDALKEVVHFLDHGEFEMAFEGLVLELVEANKKPRGFEADEWESLGRELGLEHQSVFDEEFWQRFMDWSHRIERG